MFERFGEMSSCREINELAENLLNEGDIQSLKTMAQENGIPEDYVEMYQSGDIPYLCCEEAEFCKDKCDDTDSYEYAEDCSDYLTENKSK